MLFREQPVRPSAIHIVDEFFIDANAQLLDPTLRRFDSVWRSKLVAGELPAREDIDPVDIIDLLPHIMLANIEGDAVITIDPRLVGQHHLALSGGMPPRCIVDGSAEGVFAGLKLAEVAERQQPHYSMLRVGTMAGEHFEAARAVYPLASDGVAVDRIVSVLVPYHPAGNRPLQNLMRR